MKDALKPCPFCAEDRELHVLGGGGGAYHYVACDNCATQGPDGEGEEDAVQRWNERKTR